MSFCAALGHHVLVVDDQVDRGLDRRGRDVGDAVVTVHHPVGRGADLRAVGLGNPHQLGDDVHRQLAREFVDVVHGFAVSGLLEHGVEVAERDLGDPGFEFPDAARGESLGDQGAQAQVGGIVHREERHRLRRVRAAGRRIE